MPEPTLPSRPSVNPFQVTEVGLQLTNRCNLECIHCGSRSSPEEGLGLSRGWLQDFAYYCKQGGILKLLVTGGEPFVRYDDLIFLLESCREKDIATEVTTNGFWGHDRSRAKTIVDQLVHTGLEALTLSVDGIHSTMITPQCLFNIADVMQNACDGMRVH